MRVALVAAVLLSGCPAHRPAGYAAADSGKGVFNPSLVIGGSKDGKPSRVRSELVGGGEELTGAEKFAAKQSVAREDEFHPRRSYSQKLLTMMKNMSLSETPVPRVANHTSVQELANTLMHDPMSLFRRRTRIRSSAATEAAAVAQARGDNVSMGTNCATSTTTPNETASVPEAAAENHDNSEINSHKGIPQLTLSQREALVRKWGAAFEQLEEEAFALFCRLHSASTLPVGRLTKK